MHYDHTYRSNEVSDQNDELEKVNVEFRTKFWLATVMFTMMAILLFGESGGYGVSG